jgi:hypothetical protein
MLVLVVIARENFDSGHFELFNFPGRWLLRQAFLAGVKPCDVIMHNVYWQIMTIMYNRIRGTWINCKVQQNLERHWFICRSTRMPNLTLKFVSIGLAIWQFKNRLICFEFYLGISQECATTLSITLYFVRRLNHCSITSNANIQY